MGILSFFRSKPTPATASVAKERLQVLIAHERSDREGPDYLPMLKQDILDVIKKYVSIGEEQLSVQLETQDNCDVLELNITLPEEGESDKNPQDKKDQSGKSARQPRKSVADRQDSKVT